MKERNYQREIRNLLLLIPFKRYRNYIQIYLSEPKVEKKSSKEAPAEQMKENKLCVIVYSDLFQLLEDVLSSSWLQLW